MLYRPTFTKPIPVGAEVFQRKGERYARWTDCRGKSRTARVTTTKAGTDRLVYRSPFWRYRFRDGKGVIQYKPTGCRDDVAAQGVANELRRRAELVKAEVISAARRCRGRTSAAAAGAALPSL